MNHTGGLGYHFGALRSGRKHWSAFREALGHLLSDWIPADSTRKKTLVLVGPSGGYCLNQDWVRQFDHLIVLEIDPFARLIFRARFQGPKILFIKNDLLMNTDLQLWSKFLKIHCGSPILFCNILGQLPLTLPRWVPRADRERWGHQRIHDILTAIPITQKWASFHDRISFQATSRHGSAIFSKASVLSTAEICDIASRRWKIHSVCDHGTEGIHTLSNSPSFSPDVLISKYLVWPLNSGQAHIIEWVAQRT